MDSPLDDVRFPVCTPSFANSLLVLSWLWKRGRTTEILSLCRTFYGIGGFNKRAYCLSYPGLKSVTTMMIRKRLLLWLFPSIFFISITILWWVVIEFHRDYQSIPPHHLIGNRPSTVAALKEEGFPFSFLVIGDTSGSETAETLMEMALKKGKPSFMVILGDFVKKPDIWNHRFFLTEMTVEINPSFPVFLVSGKHDID